MLLKTTHFGDLEIQAERIISFDSGIPGFPGDKEYIIVTDIDQPESPYCWLQSVSDARVALVLLDSFSIMPKYNPLVEEDDLAELGEVDLADIAVFNVAIIGADISKSTVNLKAPVVINERTKKGKQVIVKNEEYEIRHNLAECIKNAGEVPPCSR